MSTEENQTAEDSAAKQALFESLGVQEEKPNAQEVQTQTEGTQAQEETVLEDDQFTDTEKEAIRLGWKPEGVKGKKKKSAEEWMDDYSLYKKINDLGKQVQEKNHLLENVAAHLETVRATTYKQAQKDYEQKVAYLKQLASDTIDQGEMGADEVIEAYENDLRAVQQEYAQDVHRLQQSQRRRPPTPDQRKAAIMNKLSRPEQEFIVKHEKVLFSPKPDDMAVQVYVANRVNELSREGLNPSDRITAVEKELQTMFPGKFGATKKFNKAVKSSKVESASVVGKPKRGFSKNNLAPDQKELYEFFVDQGVPADELLSQFQMIIEEESK